MNKFKLVPVEPTDDELIAWAGEEQFFLFCDKDDFLDIARSVLQRYAGRSPDVRGEPVAYISHTSEGDILGWESQFDAPSHTPLYADPQPAGQQPDVSELVEALERIARHPRTRGDELGYAGCRNIAKEALAAHRKGAQP